jgi:AraC-like DNA-binding protein
LVEILLILAQQGMAGNLLHSLADTVTDRVAQQFATDLSRDWTIKEIAATLAMSERTLRRRLRAENTGFRAVLEDARLNRGVELVIASDMPIGQIAFECGYQSQSRFAQRFRLRFSMSPTELRATQDRPEALIIPIDRHRSQH